MKFVMKGSAERLEWVSLGGEKEGQGRQAGATSLLGLFPLKRMGLDLPPGEWLLGIPQRMVSGEEGPVGILCPLGPLGFSYMPAPTG